MNPCWWPGKILRVKGHISVSQLSRDSPWLRFVYSRPPEGVLNATSLLDRVACICIRCAGIATDRVARRPVCVCVCLLVTFMSPANTAKRIEMPFGRLTRAGPRNHLWDGIQIPQEDGAIFGVVRPIKKHGKSPGWAVRKRVNRSICHFGADSCGSNEPCVRWGRDRMYQFAAGRGYKSAMRPFVKIL